METSLNQNGMARHNRAAVLMLIKRSGGISRMEIAERLDLARSAVTKIANELLEIGIVRQQPLNGLRRSEPRSRLVLNKDWGYVITLSLMYELSVGVVNLAGELVHQVQVAGQGMGERSYAARFDQLVPDTIRGLASDWSDRHLLGVGVLSAGYVDRAGVIRFNGELPRRDVDLRVTLAPVTDLPVAIDQELRLLLLARLWQEPNPRWRHVVAVNPGLLGDRGRHALAINGQLYYGRDGMIGLPGRLTGVPYGKDATEGWTAQVKAWGGDEAYLQRVRGNDPEAMKIHQHVIMNYGHRLAHLSNAFNPDAVLLFSPYADMGEAFLEEVRETARGYCDSAHGYPDPTILEDIDFVFAGRRCREEWLTAAAVPILSRIFTEGIMPPAEACVEEAGELVAV